MHVIEVVIFLLKGLAKLSSSSSDLVVVKWPNLRTSIKAEGNTLNADKEKTRLITNTDIVQEFFELPNDDIAGQFDTPGQSNCFLIRFA